MPGSAFNILREQATHTACCSQAEKPAPHYTLMTGLDLGIESLKAPHTMALSAPCELKGEYP
jgi:hypothetical protein